MSYAESPAVKARAGKISNYWGEGKDVSDADIEQFLDDGSAEIDLRLAQHGIGVPATDTRAIAALRPPVADYALVRALDATFSGAMPSDEVAKLRDGADARWLAFLTSLESSGSPIIGLLQDDASAPLASSLWGKETDYGQTDSGYPEDTNARLAPYIARGDRM